jgi:hypothetical protein
MIIVDTPPVDHEANAASTITPNTNTTPSTGNISSNTSGNTPKGWYYCWTHGLGKNRVHTSATCNRKGEGHLDAATLDNMMGGNNTILRGPGPRRNHTNNQQPNTNNTTATITTTGVPGERNRN